jgi:hypothetical protein
MCVCVWNLGSSESYWRFEAIRHKPHCKDQFNEHLVKGRKAISPEIFKLETLRATDKGK